MKSNPKLADLLLSFDVGHSSIGWAVLRNHCPGVLFKTSGMAKDNTLEILGCGVVTFRADDCLASARRAYRRQRRRIRSTRQRICRMKTLLRRLGVMTSEELDRPGCAWPWKLAAQVLAGDGKQILSWPELWNVLRWYAHNRGYDGNRRWSATEAEVQKEDTKKEENARSLMEKHKARSMAETFCKEIGIAPFDQKKSSMVRFKGLNAAFSREIVENEVRKILQAHSGKLKNVDINLERALLGKDNNDKTAWQTISCPELKLPKRYQGSLLFGQLVPRFNNRIISKCPISGQKVPSRNCAEFLNFRWVMQLANIRVGKREDRELHPLSVEERKAIDQLMRNRGSLTPNELKNAIHSQTNCDRHNLDTMLIHPDAREALLLDPAQKLIVSDKLGKFWPLLPVRLQKRVRGKLRRGKSISFRELRAQMQEMGEAIEKLDAEIQRQISGINGKARKKEKQISLEAFLNESISIKRLDGRAAYARSLLRKACKEVMEGKHPKEEGGCLFITEEMRQAQLSRNTAQQTNNHLVRHRLLILERLLGHVIKEYADGEKSRVSKITIEVNRDLREMSGKTSFEKKQDLGLRIANHHKVAAELEKNLRENGRTVQITAGLIRKARIADDLDWTCPYTGQKFEPIDLVTRRVDKDHIVPRSQRMSDSLDSLVITFSAINKWKGKRTALKFVEEEQGKPVPDLPSLSIINLSRYKRFVDGLDTFKGHEDDKRRKKRRKELLFVREYEEKEFTPRDLTQTSQLVRLGAEALKRTFAGCERRPMVVSLPGSVTGTMRKGWNLLGCLSEACPQVLNENSQVKTKTDIRGITHLHHALDACVLGLASHFIPNDGHIWELIVKRNLNDLERRQLHALDIFNFNLEGRFELRDLDVQIKNQLRQRLAERRVVQHVPARMDGLRVEQNTWRVVSVKDGEANLQQRIRQTDGSRPPKVAEEKTTKLLGLDDKSKLRRVKGALVIPDNFGVALDPQPTVIPFHKVWTRLQELKTANGGKMPRVLRNGQIIQISKGNFRGIWKIFSAKNNASGMALDIGWPDIVKLKNKSEGHKINVRLATLMKDGLKTAEQSLTGIPSSSVASSVEKPER